MKSRRRSSSRGGNFPPRATIADRPASQNNGGLSSRSLTPNNEEASLKSGDSGRELRKKSTRGSNKNGSAKPVAATEDDSTNIPPQNVEAHGAEEEKAGSEEGGSEDSRKEAAKEKEPPRIMTRKRKAKDETSPPAPNTPERQPGTPLLAIDTQSGATVSVRIVLANQPYSPSQADSENLDEFLGVDGNQYYCQVCNGFGDVVCCDGCPRVYHHQCVPLHSPSRESLDNDDDPWYCPFCIGGNKEKAPSKKKGGSQRRSRGEKGDRKSSQQRCADCEEDRPDLGLELCKGCGTYVHTPSCQDSNDLVKRKKGTYCANCLAIDGEEEESNPAAEGSEYGNGEGGAPTKRRYKRRKSLSPTNSTMGGDKSIRKKKKKKKRKRSMSSTGATAEDSGTPGPKDEEGAAEALAEEEEQGPPVKAMPAFCFYLAENRWKIERALTRSHRTFNRLPKGDERNAVIAGEAADWWTKLSEAEQKQYINMSMRDFEARVVQWKEEKAVRAMGLPPAEEVTATAQDVDKAVAVPTVVAEQPPAASDTNRIDALLTYEKHERLFLNTSVGSKPFRPEPDQSYNRVLLDILHDMRFHPLPMFAVNRPENADQVIDEHNSKVTIPFFDVHGPISTSIGDECLGCTRGWTHFCSVLQRRIPAVEHRAKLQPPVSSIVSTRIGLGLRPRPRTSAPRGEDLFRWKDSDEAQKIKSLPIVPSSTLTDPSERMDDMVQFIEETTAMKVPEPPRPVFPDKNFSRKNARTLPMQRNTQSQSDSVVFNKCGRCRTLIETDTGCHQCRRAQLVINKSRKSPDDANTKGGEEKASRLKVHTAVLGRIQGRDANTESLSEGDLAVSEAMLKERWCPSAILPPQKLQVPSPFRSTQADAASEGSDVASESLNSSQHSVAKSMNDSQHSVANGKEPEGSFTAMETIPEEQMQEIEEPSEEVVDDQSDGGSKSKRLRLTRTATSTKESGVLERGRDHQEVLKLYKKEANELQRTTLQVACYSVLLALIRRDAFHLFAEPVSAEDYATFVPHPIDFGVIREKVLAEKYSSFSAFVADARLLCDNALAYNPPASLYYKTAKEMREVLDVMQHRVHDWIGTIKDAHTNYLLHQEHPKQLLGKVALTEPFEELRKKWPQAVQMLENEEELRKMVESDFMRTRENEVAYYGALAVRRTATAAEASLAPYPDSLGMYSAVAKRTHYEDEELRQRVDSAVVEATQPIMLQTVSTWREEALVRLMRKVQKIRLERRTITENGCSRCDGVLMDDEWKMALNADATHPGKPRKKGDGDIERVDHTRILLSTGLGSAKTCQKIVSRQPGDGTDDSGIDSVQDACVSVRGSRIHGMGLFADQPFSKGDVVAEYIGEYIVNPVAEEREKSYGEHRIQDYQFRLDDKLIIDATKKGGHGRYINHNCTPNCRAKIVPGKPPQEHLRRVIIVAQRSIDLNEEITYDYQFPLELDLDARIPCNCQSEFCRGFMNWDLPEKGTNNRALLVQKRGANMRDRIRRLGRPLKRYGN